MPALFSRWTNTAFVLFVIGVVLLFGGGLVALMVWVRTPYNTWQFTPVDQPVEFDHRHHVIDDQIDCLYCHPDAERSAFAGVPSTDVCMGCHAQIWNESPLLEPVRRSYFSGRPIPWNRVHNLADFVYFHHGVHVQAGIGCVRCHGRVDLMPRVYNVASLQMKWCLDCHRDPARTLARPPELGTEVTSMWGATWKGLEPDFPEDKREITRLTTCTACHR